MAEQDLDKVIESLKRLGTTSKSVQANSRYTPPSVGRAQVTLNDYRINALRAAPKLTDQINLLAEGKGQDVGALGTIGKVLIDNPISKTVLGGLTIVDTPRRAVISSVREMVDLLDNDEKTKFSFEDLFSQTKDASFGFGTAFPMEGWGGRIVGFIGDVALDPLTYATFGSSVPVSATLRGTGVGTRAALGGLKTVAGADGRFALARLAKQMGATDEIVARVAARGRSALPRQLAENMGLGRSGIYYFGSRVRVPLSGPVADAIQKGLATTRLSFFKTGIGEKLGTKFALRGTRAQADTALERFALATGRMDAAKAAFTVETLGAEDMARAATKIAQDSYAKNIGPLIQDPDVAVAKQTVYRLLDTPESRWAEFGIVPSTAELNAYNKLKPAFKQLHTDVETAFRAFDPNFTLGEIDDYLPHVATENALKLMEDSASPYAKQIREYLTVNMTDAKGSFRSRNLKKGKEWFGKILTEEDVAGGAKRLNEIAKEAVHADGTRNLLPLSFDFFETDIEKILGRYGGYYANQIGTAKYMQDLFQRGILSMGQTTWEVTDDYVKRVGLAFKEASNAYTAQLKATWENGRDVVATLRGVFEDTVRAKPTSLKPRGVLQVAVDDATAALKEIDPIEVSRARLEKAHGLLTTRMNKLEEEFATLMANFETESDVLSMLKVQHQRMMDAHRETLEALSLFYNYRNDGSFTGLVGINDDILKAVDQEGFIGPVLLDKEGRQLTVGEAKKKLQQALGDLDLEIQQTNETWKNLLKSGDELNDWLSDATRLPWDQPSKEFDQILDLFRDYKGGGRYSGLQKITTKTVQDLWTGENVPESIKVLRKLIDPKGKISGRALGKMDIAEVRSIISSGFSSSANLNDLRRASVWLIARDVIMNGGVLPTDELFAQRLNNLVQQVQIAEKIEQLSINVNAKVAKKAGAKGTAGVVVDVTTEGGQAVGAAQKNLLSEYKRLETRLQGLYDSILEEDANRIAVQTEEGTQYLAKDLGSIDAIDASLENLRMQLTTTRIEFQRVDKQLKELATVGEGKVSGLTSQQILTAATGDFRKVAENIADAASVYYINSQSTILFGKAVEDAALVGMVPSERVYKTLLSQTARYEVETAHGVLQNVLAAEQVLDTLKKRVYTYQGNDRNLFLLNELTQMYLGDASDEFLKAYGMVDSNGKVIPGGAGILADRLRAAFPEFEGIVASHLKGTNRLERVMFMDPSVSGPNGLADRALQFVGLYDKSINKPTGVVSQNVADAIEKLTQRYDAFETRIAEVQGKIDAYGTKAVTKEGGQKKTALINRRRRLLVERDKIGKKLEELDFTKRTQEAGGLSSTRRQANAFIASGQRMDVQALPGIADMSVRTRGTTGERQAAWDALHPQLKSNIERLKNVLKDSNLGDDARVAINGLIEEYTQATVRAKAKLAYATKTLEKVTGTKSQRLQASYLSSLRDTTYGKPFGMGGNLYNALDRNTAASMDTFFAELIGGSKFDPRLGFRAEKVGKNRAGGRVLQAVNTTTEKYQTAFISDYSPTGFVDSNGRFVTRVGELVDENGKIIVDEITGQPKMGRKSSRPLVTIRNSESYIGQVKESAHRRLNALRSISDDAEFIDLEDLQGVRITPESPGGFGFENLSGPRGYANQLEIQANLLDEKIKRATTLEKVISKEKKGLERTKGKAPVPSERTKRLIDSERRLREAAKRRLARLEQSPMHARALERQDFNNFLIQLASLSDEGALNADWGLNIIENPLTKPRIESIYGMREQVIQAQRKKIIDLMAKEQENLNRITRYSSHQSNPAKQSRARLIDLQTRLDELYKELEETRRLRSFEPGKLAPEERIQQFMVNGRPETRPAPTLAQIQDIKPELRFGFAKDEWEALFTPARTATEQRAIENEYAALRARLAALHKQEEVIWNSPWPYNFSVDKRIEIKTQIDETMKQLEELRYLVNIQNVRDSAVLKAKYLHEHFKNIGLELYASKDVSADKALTHYVFRNRIPVNGQEYQGTTGARRKFLREVFIDSEEGKHLAEVSKARGELKTTYIDAQTEKLDNYKLARASMRKTIADSRKEIKELKIAEGVKAINETVVEAEKASGGKLPKVAAKTLKGDTKRTVKAIEKNIAAGRDTSPFFVRSEELFGSLEAAQNNKLSALQLRRRQVAQQLADMDYAILGEQTAQREAREVIKELSKLSERQASVLGLPSRGKLLKNISLAKQMAAQTEKVAGISKSLGEKTAQIGSEYATLSDAVAGARRSFDNSVLFRKTAEENVEEAKKAIESVREVAKRATETLTGTKGMKKDPASIAAIDGFLAEVDNIMPLLDDPRVDREIKRALSIYTQSKSELTRAELAKTLAQRENAVAQGIRGLTATELGSVDLPLGAINLKTQFDEGFVQLSQFFPNIGVRQELAEIVQNVHRLQDPALVRELSKALGTYTKFFKSYATLSPGFHIRNAFSNFFMLFAAGGKPSTLLEGAKFSKLWTQMSAEGKTFEQFIAAVPEASRQKVSDAFMAAASSGGGMTDDAFREGALWGTKTSKKVGQWIEQHSRFMLAYDGIAQGMDFHTATARVRRFLIDYENLSAGDQVMRQIIPFWMWTSRNLPLQVQNIWMNPKPYQIYGAIKRNLTADKEGQPVPAWLEETGAFKLPFGKDLYATPDFGFNRINQQINEIRDPARYLSNLNPLLRLPIELSGNRQFYSNRPFSKTPVQVEGGLSSAFQPVMQALGYGETGPDGKKYVDDKAFYALRNLLPMVSTGERLIPSTPTYQQRGTLNQWLGFTGVPVRQNTPAMQESELKRRKQLLVDFLAKQRAIGAVE